MATETPPPDGMRRKRPAPTIELEATEVAAQSQETAETASEDREPFIPPPPEVPHHHAAPGEPELDRHSTMPPGFSWPMIGAGAAGAGGVLVAFLLLWAIGAMPGKAPEPVDHSPRLAAMEAQLRDLAARPAPTPPPAPPSAPGVDPKVVEGLASRFDKIEAAVNAPRQPATDPAMLNRIGAVDGAVKNLSDNIAAMVRRNDEAATATKGRLDALAAAVVEVEKKERDAGSDKPARLAVAAGALRVTVESGRPFAAELAMAKSLTPDPGPLGPLEPFAASGIPNDAALGRELAALIQPILQAAMPQASTGDYLDRLQANVEKLVRIRPIDAPAGDDPAAMLARIEFKAARGDVAGALAELAKLQPDYRAKVQPWVTKTEARDKAVAASRRFYADTVAALKTP